MDILHIYDGGIVTDEKGRRLGEIRFEVQTSEGKSETLIGNCHPNFRDSIIKNPKRLVWKRPGQMGENNPG